MTESSWGPIWEDQSRFNAKFRPIPSNQEEYVDQVKDICLHLQSEVHELLNTVAWKKHRRLRSHRPNMAHSHEELVDIFKYFVTLAYMMDVSPEDLQRLYWQKSAVCEQRYVEEWVSDYARGNPLARVALVDLDGVLLDYVQHFGEFLYNRAYAQYRPAIRAVMAEHRWVNADSVGMPADEFDRIKHEFRTGGHKVSMPMMPGAKEFLDFLIGEGYVIIIVTSRPIDRYPNMMTETIACLQRHGLNFDHIWHGPSKKQVVLASRLDPLPRTIIAVDDDPGFIEEYISLGIKTFYVTRPDAGIIPCAIPVRNLNEVRIALTIHPTPA